MSGIIHIRQALHKMESLDPEGNPVPFSLRAITYNRHTKSGGQVREYANAVLSRNNKRNPLEKVRMQGSSQEKPGKNPNHFSNRTRNILTTSGNIVKINIGLIIGINGQKVYL